MIMVENRNRPIQKLTDLMCGVRLRFNNYFSFLSNFQLFSLHALGSIVCVQVFVGN